MKTMKNLLLIILLTAFTRSYCQPNFYERTYGPGTGMSIDKALNGNFIIGANQGTYPYYHAYYFLIDSHGDTIRTMNYSTSGLACVRQTADSGFIFTGDSSSVAGIYKTDSVGNILWRHTYPSDIFGDLPTYSQSVILNNENGYFVSFIEDGNGPENPYIILKTDSVGNTLDSTIINPSIGYWSQNFLTLTRDSGLISANIGGTGDFFNLTKLDKNDNIVWSKIFQDTAYISLGSKCAIQTNDGGYLAAGYKTLPFGGPKYGYIIKTDANGDSLWSKSYYFPNENVSFLCVLEDSYGQFYITGEIKDSNNLNQYSIIILKTTSTGDTLWTRLFSGFGVASPNSLIFDIAQNPMVLGYTQDSANGQPYIYLIKTDTAGNIPLGIIQLAKNESDVNIYPNPTFGTFTFSYNSQTPILNSQLKIYDVLGQEVYTQAITNPNQTTINVSQLSNGVYFYQLTNNTETYRGKFLKE